MLDKLKQLIQEELLSELNNEYSKNEKEINYNINKIKKSIENNPIYNGKNRLKVFCYDLFDKTTSTKLSNIFPILSVLFLGICFFSLLLQGITKQDLFFLCVSALMFFLLIVIFYFNMPNKTENILKLENLKEKKYKLEKRYNDRLNMINNIFKNYSETSYTFNDAISLPILEGVKEYLNEDQIKELLMKGKNKEINCRDLIELIKFEDAKIANEKAFNKIMKKE